MSRPDLLTKQSVLPQQIENVGSCGSLSILMLLECASRELFCLESIIFLLIFTLDTDGRVFPICLILLVQE